MKINLQSLPAPETSKVAQQAGMWLKSVALQCGATFTGPGPGMAIAEMEAAALASIRREYWKSILNCVWRMFVLGVKWSMNVLCVVLMRRNS